MSLGIRISLRCTLYGTPVLVEGFPNVSLGVSIPMLSGIASLGRGTSVFYGYVKVEGAIDSSTLSLGVRSSTIV